MGGTVRIAGLIILSSMVGGCLWFGRSPSAFDQEVAQLQHHVGLLEERVYRLSSSSAISSSVSPAGPGVAAVDGWESAGAGGPEAGGAYATTGGSANGGSWPRWPTASGKMLTKLLRGVVNVVTGWVEIPKRVHETSQTSGAGAGLTFGLLRGFGYGFVRTLGGAYEVITFPFPAPPDYRPVMQPEYIFLCDPAMAGS